MDFTAYPRIYFENYATQEEKDKIMFYYINNNKTQLKALCKEANIKQYSYRCKDELAVMLATNKPFSHTIALIDLMSGF